MGCNLCLSFEKEFGVSVRESQENNLPALLVFWPVYFVAFSDTYLLLVVLVLLPGIKRSTGNDLDVVVKMIKSDLFMVHVKEKFENNCQTEVDIVHYHDKMNGLKKTN